MCRKHQMFLVFKIVSLNSPHFLSTTLSGSLWHNTNSSQPDEREMNENLKLTSHDQFVCCKMSNEETFISLFNNLPDVISEDAFYYLVFMLCPWFHLDSNLSLFQCSCFLSSQIYLQWTAGHSKFIIFQLEFQELLCASLSELLCYSSQMFKAERIAYLQEEIPIIIFIFTMLFSIKCRIWNSQIATGGGRAF